MQLSKKISELMTEIAVATENLDEEYINELKPQVNELKSLNPGNKYIAVMDDWIKEAEKFIAKYARYKSEKQVLLQKLMANGTDEQEAEEDADEIAWANLDS